MAKQGQWRKLFLSALRNTGNVRASCLVAGIERKTAYNARDRDEQFRAAWNEALDEAVEILEAEARRRAMTISDTLLIFLLKAHRPDVYRETIRHEATDKAGDVIDTAVLVARLAKIVDRQRALQPSSDMPVIDAVVEDRAHGHSD